MVIGANTDLYSFGNLNNTNINDKVEYQEIRS
jgi:hypothetical protein